MKCTFYSSFNDIRCLVLSFSFRNTWTKRHGIPPNIGLLITLICICRNSAEFCCSFSERDFADVTRFKIFACGQLVSAEL